MYLLNRDKRLVGNIGYQTRPLRPDAIYTDAIHRGNKLYFNHNNLPYVKRTDYDGVYQSGSGQSGNGRYGSGQSGSGIEDLSNVIDAFKTLAKIGSTAIDMYSSETGTLIKNAYGKWMNKSNPNWRPGFAGEKHMINSKGVTYNYLGPGTKLKERLARGDPPLDGQSGMDQVAKVHDIDYSNATSWTDVWDADKKFIKNIDKAKANRISKTLIKNLMRSKMIGEKVGIINPRSITSYPNIQSDPPTLLSGGEIKRKKEPKDPLYKLKRNLKKNMRKTLRNRIKHKIIT